MAKSRTRFVGPVLTTTEITGVVLEDKDGCSEFEEDGDMTTVAVDVAILDAPSVAVPLG